MRFRDVLAALIVGGLVLLAAPSGAVASRGPVRPDFAGPWLVGDRAGGQPVLDKTRDHTSVPFELASDARQGPDEFYTFRLQIQVEFESVLAEGATARIVASANSGAAALVTFRKQADGVRVFYDGYVTGSHAEVVAQGTTSIDYENYVQTKGIRGGPGTFEVQLQDRGRLIKTVHVDQPTGLYRTTVPPEQLTMSTPTEIHAEAGEPFDIPYHVTRRGDRPDKPVTVSAELAGGPIRLTNADDSYDAVRGGRKGDLQAVATEPGRYQVRLTARGGYNTPASVVLVVVEPPSANTGAMRAVAATGLALIGLIVLWRTRKGHHHGRGSKVKL